MPGLVHLRDFFSSPVTNIRPEDAFSGKIIIIDLPVQEFRLAGRVANLAWKYCFQVAVLRRTQPTQPDTYLRPVFLWADEAHTIKGLGYSETPNVEIGNIVTLTDGDWENIYRIIASSRQVDDAVYARYKEAACLVTPHATNLLNTRNL
jgi:hypothetical protein